MAAEELQTSFIFYTEWSEYFTDLSNEEIGELMRAVLVYKQTKKETPFSDRSLKFVFNLIKNQLDRDAEKWEETKNARSEAGKRGAKKRWTEEEPAAENNNAITENGKNSNAIVCHNEPLNEMAKMAVNVNVNDNVNESVNVNVDVPQAGQTGIFIKNNNKIPTLRDVEDYCKEKGFKLSPFNFFSYYSTRNWVINGSPVSNWQKLCDKWETLEKPKEPPKFKPAKNPAAGLPELPVCDCGCKTIYASGVCRCPNCIDHYWEIQSGAWCRIDKIEIGFKLPKA